MTRYPIGRGQLLRNSTVGGLRVFSFYYDKGKSPNPRLSLHKDNVIMYSTLFTHFTFQFDLWRSFAHIYFILAEERVCVNSAHEHPNEYKATLKSHVERQNITQRHRPTKSTQREN